MATAAQARDWARVALRGIGDSLYTPFCGPDGDDIDWAAYRHLVRYCVGDLHSYMRIVHARCLARTFVSCESGDVNVRSSTTIIYLSIHQMKHDRVLG